jgi:hypothetical protein
MARETQGAQQVADDQLPARAESNVEWTFIP